MATAGTGSEVVFPTGSRAPLAGTLLEDVLAANGPVYRPRLEADRYTEEREFLELGLGSRVAAPLFAGAKPGGMLSLLRRGAGAASPRRGGAGGRPPRGAARARAARTPPQRPRPAA